jgi:hypothetical protein
MKTRREYFALILITLGLLVVLALPGILAAIYQRPTSEIILGVVYPWLCYGLGVVFALIGRHYHQRKWKLFFTYCLGMLPLFIIAWVLHTLWPVSPVLFGVSGGSYVMGNTTVRILIGEVPASSPN